MDAITKLRRALYLNFPTRADAIMNLLDAISSSGHIARSVVQLSESPAFERCYTSITDAIATGLPKANWNDLEATAFNQCFDAKVGEPPCFLVDCTPNPRPFAKTLHDKSIVHAPNPAPGNKPICVGHSYSCTTLLPSDHHARDKKWVVPISARCVRSDELGHEVGMDQVLEHLNSFGLKDQLAISVGDSLYGSEGCRIKAAQAENLVHIFRLKSQRNVFKMPENSSEPLGRGRRKEYGEKIRLNNESTLPKPDQQANTGFMARSGKVYSVRIAGWENMLLRGSKTYRGAKHPITLVRISVVDSDGNPVFKRPLWLGVIGKLRSQVSLVSIYQYYRARYDIEHWFRFAKSKLLIDAYQTPEAVHEAHWWRLCMLAYLQLYMARELVNQNPKPWERYLPSFKDTVHNPSPKSPAQVQRGFGQLLAKIGTPAKPCIPRGRVSGRKAGMTPDKRSESSIVFKAAHTQKNSQNLIITDLDKPPGDSNPKEIHRLVKTVVTTLRKHQFEPVEFNNLVLNSS